MVEQEIIQTDHFESERPQDCVGEILNVLCNDRVGTATQSGSNDVSIVGIGKIDRLLKGLPSLDERILERFVHRSEPAQEPAPIDVRMDSFKCTKSLVNDTRRPQRAEGTRISHAQQSVARRDGHQHTCVKEGSEPRHRSRLSRLSQRLWIRRWLDVIQAVLCRLPSQLVKAAASICALTLPVRQYIVQP